VNLQSRLPGAGADQVTEQDLALGWVSVFKGAYGLDSGQTQLL
jgi:hypothetical protein